jgi:NAD(P)-dependent dehydrogenase (short-subunit alcohol dehydrogenase family)
VRVDGCVALVTGGNRGLGAVFARILLERGARRVYSGARDPGSITGAGVVPVRLDITEPGQVADAAERCSDVTLLVNNAGVLADSPLLAAPTEAAARAEMEVNYFGTLAMCRAFAPVLARNGGGALVNVLSIASFFTNPAMGSYAASKAAAWALTNGARVELRGQGTQVVAVHSGYIDTDMAADVTAPKASPETVVATTLDALETGAEEVLADERTRQIKAAVPTDLDTIYPGIQSMWDRRSPRQPTLPNPTG